MRQTSSSLRAANVKVVDFLVEKLRMWRYVRSLHRCVYIVPRSSVTWLKTTSWSEEIGFDRQAISKCQTGWWSKSIPRSFCFRFWCSLKNKWATPFIYLPGRGLRSAPWRYLLRLADREGTLCRTVQTCRASSLHSSTDDSLLGFIQQSSPNKYQIMSVHR